MNRSCNKIKKMINKSKDTITLIPDACIIANYNTLYIWNNEIVTTNEEKDTSSTFFEEVSPVFKEEEL